MATDISRGLTASTISSLLGLGQQQERRAHPELADITPAEESRLYWHLFLISDGGSARVALISAQSDSLAGAEHAAVASAVGDFEFSPLVIPRYMGIAADGEVCAVFSAQVV